MPFECQKQQMLQYVEKNRRPHLVPSRARARRADGEGERERERERERFNTLNTPSIASACFSSICLTSCFKDVLAHCWVAQQSLLQCFWSHCSDVPGHLRWVLGSLAAAILPLSIDSFTNDQRVGGGHCGAFLYHPVNVYITMKNHHFQW